MYIVLRGGDGVGVMLCRVHTQLEVAGSILFLFLNDSGHLIFCFFIFIAPCIILFSNLHVSD